MSSIDKLALTCRLLYDERVLEQRKEIEKLQVQLFFKDFTGQYFHAVLRRMNWHTRCKCKHCERAGRNIDTVDEEAACTFAPWLDNILHERGLVVYRQNGFKHLPIDGPFEMKLFGSF